MSQVSLFDSEEVVCILIEAQADVREYELMLSNVHSNLFLRGLNMLYRPSHKPGINLSILALVDHSPRTGDSRRRNEKWQSVDKPGEEPRRYS